MKAVVSIDWGCGRDAAAAYLVREDGVVTEVAHGDSDYVLGEVERWRAGEQRRLRAHAADEEPKR